MEQQTYSMKKLMVTEEGKKLWYAEKTDGITEVYNQIRNEYLGKIEKLRVGRFMHWCFFPSSCELGDMWFSNGCLKEISSFITSLYSKRRKTTSRRIKR